jgi:hypothetical protein
LSWLRRLPGYAENFEPLIKGRGFYVEATIFILGPVVILLFAAVVRIFGTNIGYKILIVVIVIYFVLRR